MAQLESASNVTLRNWQGAEWTYWDSLLTWRNNLRVLEARAVERRTQQLEIVVVIIALVPAPCMPVTTESTYLTMSCPM
jgi:hypothetical protein